MLMQTFYIIRCLLQPHFTCLPTGDWKEQIGNWGNSTEVDPRRRSACREQTNRPTQPTNCVSDMARNMSSYGIYHPHQVSFSVHLFYSLALFAAATNFSQILMNMYRETSCVQFDDQLQLRLHGINLLCMRTLREVCKINKFLQSERPAY